MKTICVFGDSIVWGACDVEKGGWVNRLGLYFVKGNDPVLVYNLGISGETTIGVLRRFTVEADVREPSLVVFSIGINDSLDSPRPDTYTQNMQKLVELARQRTKQLMVIGLTNVDEKRTQPVEWDSTVYYSNQRIQTYDQALKKIAEQNKINYVPLFGILTPDDIEDGVHPNALGHQKIYLRVKEYLLQNKLI